MASYINAALYSGRRTADRDRYDSNVRKAYRRRVEQQGEKTEEKQSGNLLTKFADMVSLPQQMEQAANLQMYGNESTKKLGEVLDTRNEEKIANAKDEISYVAERGAVGAADKLEGLVNAVGYAGQAYNRTQQLQNSQDAAMWGAVTGSDTQKSLSQRLEQAALKSSQEGLKDTVTFGDDLRADVERRHANSNISKMGRVAADVSEAAGGLLPSVAVNLIAPGSGLAANAVNAISAAGNAVQEAKKSGANDLRAAGYGLAAGGIEFAAEKVVDGLSGLFGRGALDDIIENAVEKYLTNQTAKRVVTAAGSAFGEGAEEFISEIGGRLANEWLINTDDRSFRETLKDGLYSGLIGMLLSGGTQAGGSVVNAALRDAPDSNRTAGQYRADLPRNVDLPTVPIINLSMQSVADLNGGTLPQTGNALRKNAIDRARARLGLDENSAAYIPASNVLRNGEEYVLKITPSSLKKMLSPADGNAVQIESIAILDNIERIANNGVWFDSQGDRKNRTQINGIDHLKTTVYIDNAPYEVDMRVRLVQENPQAQTENVLYYYTPEEAVSIKKVGTTPPTDERRALIGASEGVPTLPTSVPHSAQSVNEQKLHIAPPQKSELIQEGYRLLKSGQMVSDELLSAMGVTQRQAKSIVNAARTNTNTRPTTTTETDYTPYLEQLKQAQRNKKVRDLQDAYQKFLESEQSIQIVQMKDNSKRIEKSVQEPYNNFKTTDDPMREVAGAGEKSHPQEIARIKKELEKTGAEVEYRDNAMCYQPGLVSGRPGRFVIDRNASYSAWMHEYTHFLDDQKDGFLGFKVFMDLQRCIQREINAYNVEIELAKKENRQDIVDRLEALKKKEIARYESNAKDD